MILYFDAAMTRPWRWGMPVHEPRQPHLVRLACLLIGDGGQMVDRWAAIVRPLEGWLPFHATEIARHNVSEDIARAQGQPLHEVLDRFRTTLRASERAVAHSLEFHKRAIIRSLGDIGEYATGSGWPPTYCTMTQGAPVVKALNAKNKQKWPSLAEAFAYFRNNSPLELPEDPLERGIAIVDAVRIVYDGLQRKTWERH
jgi:hypothetical protein